MISLAGERGAAARHQGGESIRSGLNQAGPVALAGLVINGTAALVVVVVARLVSSQAYGAIAQLLGLFFIVSMPGSAVLVGVVRRATSLQNSEVPVLIRRWAARLHLVAVIGITLELVVVLVLQGWIARQLSLPDTDGVVLILVAAGVWILLSIDRGLLQARRRYRALAGNLLLEGFVRTCLVVVLVIGHLGVAGYGLGILISELAATAHARWLVSRAWSASEVSAAANESPAGMPGMPAEAAEAAEAVRRHRRLMADVATAFAGLALLGFLQNVDVILLGRLHHASVGPYAAISVASKALVFGALALGAYLLPEATIRWNEGGHAVRQLGVALIFLTGPAVVLLTVSVLLPARFLTLVFGARLSSAAPAFAMLVVAMMFLSISVLITNYLFGTGSRWILFLLAGGSVLATTLISAANGDMVATARGDLTAQGVLALGMVIAFVSLHQRGDRCRWRPGWSRPPRAAAAIAAADPQ